MTEPKEATRKTIVKQVRILYAKRGDPFFNLAFGLEDKANVEEYWRVHITTQEGMLPETTHSIVCLTQEQATEIENAHPIGTEIDSSDAFAWVGLEDKRREFLLAAMDSGFTPGACNAGDEEAPLSFDTLDAAGITEGYKLTQAVLDYVGKQRVGELKAKYGENWSTAVAYQYCLLNLPHSSPAFIAAAYQFNWYITGDDFKAGYLWRDLECVVSGAETEALKAIQMRQKAGEKGRQSSTHARNKRILSLLSGMESTARRNPDIIKLGPKSLAALGLGEAIEADPKLWSQGRGQVEEYLGEIRRGEAGEDIQVRYLALLPGKTA